MNENSNFDCMICGRSNPSGSCGRKDCPYGVRQNDGFEDEDLGVSPVAMSAGEACHMEEGCEGCQ